MAEKTNVQILAEQRELKRIEDEAEKKLLTYEKLSEMSGYKKELIQIMHKTVAKNTSPAELAYFLTVSQAIGLNPINKEIWCYKDHQANLIVFTGRDGFLKKNKENTLFRGMRSSEVRENDHFLLDMIEGNVEHKFGAKDRGEIMGAYCIVWIEGQKPTIKWVDFKEFDKKQAQWKVQPAMMIKKVAESHALKEAAGITGIQSDTDFEIRDGIAYGQEEQRETINPEEMRLIKLIEKQTTVEGLKALEKEVKTEWEGTIYAAKMNDLMGV